MTRAAPETGWIALLMGALVQLIGADAIQAQSVQRIAREAFGSTVLLIMEDPNGQPLSLGSGFFVGENAIASNLHVVEGAGSGFARIVGQDAKHEIKGIIAADPERDLIILKVSEVRASALDLGNSDTVRVGEPVYAVGNPQGLEGTFSQGIISGIRQAGSSNLLQITAPISPGSSGGPVLNDKGQAIGVSVATYKGGQNLNFAIPINYVKDLLEKIGPVIPLNDQNSNKTQRSILADLEDGGSESVVASHFNWLVDNESSIWANGRYTFSIRNNLREPVRNVLCLVVFIADDGLPVDAEVVMVEGPIHGKLAKRSHVCGSERRDVRELAAKIEIRILDFRLSE